MKKPRCNPFEQAYDAVIEAADRLTKDAKTGEDDCGTATGLLAAPSTSGCAHHPRGRSQCEPCTHFNSPQLDPQLISYGLMSGAIDFFLRAHHPWDPCSPAPPYPEPLLEQWRAMRLRQLEFNTPEKRRAALHSLVEEYVRESPDYRAEHDVEDDEPQGRAPDRETPHDVPTSRRIQHHARHRTGFRCDA